jgi:radical SAM superfamily enzyme YgiQ (UPF0313 family)
VQRATRLLQRRGIQVGMFIMLGYLGEEESDLQATVEHLKRSAPDVFLTTVAYPIKGTPYYEDVRGQLVEAGAWASRTDRDLGLRQRRSAAYYRFARRWLVSAVDRHRHWQAGRYARAARSAALAGVGRLGMALLGGRGRAVAAEKH